MYDLIYAGNQVRSQLEQAFPAHYDEASDDIHQARFSVECEDSRKEQYRTTLRKLGLTAYSLQSRLDSLAEQTP